MPFSYISYLKLKEASFQSFLKHHLLIILLCLHYACIHLTRERRKVTTSTQHSVPHVMATVKLSPMQPNPITYSGMSSVLWNYFIFRKNNYRIPPCKEKPGPNCIFNLRTTPGKDSVIEGAGWATPQAVSVCNHLLHPLHPRVETKNTSICHGFHKVGIFNSVSSISQGQTHACRTGGQLPGLVPPAGQCPWGAVPPAPGQLLQLELTNAKPGTNPWPARDASKEAPPLLGRGQTDTRTRSPARALPKTQEHVRSRAHMETQGTHMYTARAHQQHVLGSELLRECRELKQAALGELSPRSSSCLNQVC